MENSIDVSLECLLFDIKALAFQIREVKFTFVQRSGNLAAHAVASYAISRGDSLMGYHSPEFLFNILATVVTVSIRI